jgi:hypothetical protein
MKLPSLLDYGPNSNMKIGLFGSTWVFEACTKFKHYIQLRGNWIPMKYEPLKVQPMQLSKFSFMQNWTDGRLVSPGLTKLSKNNNYNIN